jgi:hypothetical protein
MGNIEGSSQFRIMIYLYDIDNELHIITLQTNNRESHKENLGCPMCGNNTTNYIMIMEVSLFNKILKYYIDYFDIFEFIVNNLMVTYHPMWYKEDLNINNKVQLLRQLTGTRLKSIRNWIAKNIRMNKQSILSICIPIITYLLHSR